MRTNPMMPVPLLPALAAPSFVVWPTAEMLAQYELLAAAAKRSFGARPRPSPVQFAMLEMAARTAPFAMLADAAASHPAAALFAAGLPPEPELLTPTYRRCDCCGSNSSPASVSGEKEP